jgi:O-antigen/teichoic acid export membrane protein
LYDSGGQPLLRLVLCGVASLAGAPLWVLGAAFSAAAAICLVAAVPHARASLRRVHAALSGRPRWDADTARSFWSFSAPRGVEEIFAATNIWLLLILVGSLFSAPEAATYAAISRFTLAASLFMQAVTTGMAPRFTAAFSRGERARAQSLFRVTTQWMVGVSVPVCATLFVYPQALLTLVSPDLPDGTTGLQITAVAAMFTVVTGPAGGAILFAGRSTWNLQMALAAFAVMLVVAFAAIPEYGANGASLAWAAAMVVQSALAYVVARRAFGLDPFSRTVLLLGSWSAILSGVALLVPRLLLGDGLAALFIGVTATGVALVLLHHVTSWTWWNDAPADPSSPPSLQSGRVP